MLCLEQELMEEGVYHLQQRGSEMAVCAWREKRIRLSLASSSLHCALTNPPPGGEAPHLSSQQVLHSSHPMVRLLHLYSETNCPRIFPVQCGKQQMEVCRGKAERTGPVVAVVPRLSLAAGSEFR
ncbi:uncharacterized [Tachysurus ichikawai]